MQHIFGQLTVFLVVVLLATIKSLRFSPSGPTDFELNHMVKQGQDAAMAEQHWRRRRPVLSAMQRFSEMLLAVGIVVGLGVAYGFIVALVGAVIWLVLAEFLAVHTFVRRLAEKLASRYRVQLLQAADRLQPWLSVFSDKPSPVTMPTFYSKAELLQILGDGHEVLSRQELAHIRQALRLDAIKIASIMTPASAVLTVKKTDTLGPVLLDALHKSGQRAFAVIGKDLDHVLGVVMMQDGMPVRPGMATVADVMRPTVGYVNQELSILHALQACLHTGQYLFIVVNELGQTTGVITAAQIVQHLLGRQLADRFDGYTDRHAVAQLAAAAQSGP